MVRIPRLCQSETRTLRPQSSSTTWRTQVFLDWIRKNPSEYIVVMSSPRPPGNACWNLSAPMTKRSQAGFYVSKVTSCKALLWVRYIWYAFESR
jgi:hypothetical protein